MKAERIFETILYAEELKAVKPFYENVMGLELITESSLFLGFRLAQSVLLIFNPEESRERDRDIPWHGAKGEGHIAFALSEGTIDEWKSHLKEMGVPIEKEVTWSEGGVSLYLRDPAGNSVELAPPTLWGSDWDF